MCFHALSFFGIGASTELRNVAGETLFLIFIFAIVLLAFLLYLFCGFLGLLFWSFKNKNGGLSKKSCSIFVSKACTHSIGTGSITYNKARQHAAFGCWTRYGHRYAYYA